jgi:hypothetical protein
MEKGLDLFENYHLLPENVQEVLMRYGEMDQTYENCSSLKEELDVLGYSMEYGLDAVPFNLKEK